MHETIVMHTTAITANLITFFILYIIF